MSNNIYKYSLSTHKSQEFISITNLADQAVRDSGVKNGIALIYCPHTTAGITINENTDPDVVKDMIGTLDKIFPANGDYKHIEGNSHAHIKASNMGASCTVIISDGRIMLGTWQGIFFCEFDGPRQRQVYIKVQGD